MRPRARSLTFALPFALLVAVGLVLAPAASAAVYCVAPATGCADGGFSTVQAALTQAQSNPGPDEVHLGASTYTTASGFTYDDGGSVSNSVTIAGAGRTATTLTRSTNGTILGITGNARNTLGDLRFHLVTGGTIPSAGLLGGSVDLFRVDVDADPAVANSEGLQTAPGSVHDARVSMATSGGTIGIVGGGMASTDGVFDSTVVADKAVNLFAGSLQHTRVTGGQAAIAQASGTIDDVSVRLVGSGPFSVGLAAESSIFSSGTMTLTARHLTIAGNGQPGSVGVSVSAAAGISSTVESVSLRSSIVRGVATSFNRSGTSAGPPPTGTANLSVLYTDYDPATGTQSGLGTGPDLTDPRNVDADPRFVDAAGGDLRLRGGSPAIDAGDPAGLGLTEPLTDLGGAARVLDGNGDGTARGDMGAFEYQRRAPVLTSATAVPSSAASGARVAFAATASDPDGDDVALAWRFDDGASAAGGSVGHAFAAAGKHLATVTATDSAGLQTSAQVHVTTVAARLTALSLAPAAFRPAGRGPSATASARRKAKPKPPATGATVSFRLTTRASVRFTVERARGGRKVRGRCAAPTRGNRHGKRCTRYVAVKGSFARTGAAGRTLFHFSGRLNGKALGPGAYRLVASTGKGKARSVRRAAFTIKRPAHRRS